MKRSHYTREKGQRARELCNNTDRVERKLWDFLCSTPIDGFTFVRQHKVGPYVLDFFCPEAKIAIELDANQAAAGMSGTRTTARNRLLGRRRIQVIRFAAEELTNNFAGVCDGIGRALLETPLAFPDSGEG